MAEQEKKQRNTGMKWLKLGVDKDPEFGVQYFLFGNSGSKEKPKDDYQVGALAGINSLPEVKQFSWFIEGQEDERKHFTHFAVAKKPVE